MAKNPTQKKAMKKKPMPTRKVFLYHLPFTSFRQQTRVLEVLSKHLENKY